MAAVPCCSPPHSVAPVKWVNNTPAPRTLRCLRCLLLEDVSLSHVHVLHSKEHSSTAQEQQRTPRVTRVAYYTSKQSPYKGPSQRNSIGPAATAAAQCAHMLARCAWTLLQARCCWLTCWYTRQLDSTAHACVTAACARVTCCCLLCRLEACKDAPAGGQACMNSKAPCSSSLYSSLTCCVISNLTLYHRLCCGRSVLGYHAAAGMHADLHKYIITLFMCAAAHSPSWWPPPTLSLPCSAAQTQHRPAHAPLAAQTHPQG
jgi:hypothetical protein